MVAEVRGVFGTPAAVDSVKEQALCKQTGASPCGSVLNGTNYSLKFWARASHQSAAADAATGAAREMEASVLLGGMAPTAKGPAPGGSAQPSKFIWEVQATTKLGRDWAEVSVELPAAPSKPARAALHLQLGGAVGTVWLDDVVMPAHRTSD